MRLKSSALVAGLASGVGLWLSFPDPSLFPLAWVCLVPFLLFLLSRPAWKGTLLAHFALGSVYFGGTLCWIPRVLTRYASFDWFSAAAVFGLMIVALSLFLLPFTALVRWFAGRNAEAALWAAPGAWTLCELLRNHFAVGGFPWSAIGYSQQSWGSVIQIADLGGVYLVGMLVVFANCAWAGLLQRRKTARLAALFGVSLVVANLYGLYRLLIWEPTSDGALRIALVQPNIELSERRDYFARMYFEVLPKYYASAVEKKADWVIFPELPNPFVFERDYYYTSFWRREVAQGGVPLLFNGTALDEQGRKRNSAFLLARDGAPVYRYDKAHLVPFGEYLPYGSVLGFARPLVRDVGGFAPGDKTEAATGPIDGVRFGALICYEIIFPELSRRAALEGANLLVNITNDGWFGRTAAPVQHLQMASFRAVEQRKTLVRAANTGFTAVIDAWGRIQRGLGLFEEGTLLVEAPVNQYRSLYCRLGDWSWGSVAALSILFAATRRRRRSGRAGRKSRPARKRGPKRAT